MAAATRPLSNRGDSQQAPDSRTILTWTDTSVHRNVPPVNCRIGYPVGTPEWETDSPAVSQRNFGSFEFLFETWRTQRSARPQRPGRVLRTRFPSTKRCRSAASAALEA